MKMGKALLLLVMVMSIFASLRLINPQYPLHTDSSSIELVNYAVYSSSGSTKIYPGSSNARIVVDLRNNANESISDVQACFYLPNGFSVSGGTTCVDATTLNGTYKKTYDPGELFRVETRFNVDSSVRPGRYYFEIHILYTVNTSRFEDKVYVPVDVQKYPKVNITVVDSWWDSVKVFPGTRGATLNLMIKNVGNVTINGGNVEAILPENLSPHEIRTTIGALNTNETTTLSLNNIDIPVTVPPGNYTIILKLNITARTEDGVSYHTHTSVKTNITIFRPKPLLLKVINAYWGGGAAYSEGRGLSLRLTLQNLDHARIEALTAKLILPRGMRSLDNKSYVITTLQTAEDFGSIFTLTFNNINVSPNSEVLRRGVNLTVILDIVGSYRNAEFYVSQQLRFNASLINESTLALVSERWVLNGRPSLALPSSEDVTLDITLMNLGLNTITSIKPHIKLPEGFKLKSVSGSCINTGVQPGRTCSLQLTLDVGSKVKPQIYKGTLILNYVISSANSLQYSSTCIKISLPVEDPKEYFPKLVLGKYWWGTTSPQTVYSNARMVPLHLEVVNLGRRTVSNVYLSIEPLNKSIRVIEGKGLCASTLGSGNSCRYVAYVDLGNVVKGYADFKVEVNYTLTIYNSFIKNTKTFTIRLPVEVYAALLKYGRLEITNWGWLNNQPVFPNTENATYTISIANHYPFSIEAINVTLYLPKGFISKEGGKASNYIAGPINSNQEFTANFIISVGNVSPGRYLANVKITYVVNVGGSEIAREEIMSVPIVVSKIRYGIEYVTSGWYASAPEPMTYGNTFYIVLRNTDFPEIKGVYAELFLPHGIISSETNKSVVNITPSTTPISEVVLAQQVTGGKTLGGTIGLARILRSLSTQQMQTSAVPSQTSYSKGDLITFIVKLNVLNITPGTYYAYMRVSFLDNWDTLRVFRVKVPITVLGSSKVIKVWAENSLRFTKRYGTLDLGLVNVGSSPIYNAYLFIYSRVPYVVIADPLRYFNILPPNKVVRLRFNAYFNPAPVQGFGSPVTYGSIPLIASISYTDVNGFRHVFNTSFVVTVEPYIEIDVSDVKAVFEDGVIKVSGTLTNLGNAKAERVEVLIKYSGMTSQPNFVGDIDPSSQASFSVTLGNVSYEKKVLIIIKYRNPFNELLTTTKEYPVVRMERKVTTTTPTGFLGTTELTTRVVIIIAVVLFLVIVALAIRSFLRRHSESSIIEGGEGVLE